MISIETEARIAKIFLELAQGEQNTEAIRLALGQLKDFDPYNIFRLLDKSFKNSLNEYDIVTYLKYEYIN